MARILKFNPMRYRIPILKRLLPSVRKRLASWLWPNGFTVRRSMGACFLVSWRNYVDRQIAFYDDFEAPQFDVFLGTMARTGCDVFLDVGANIGYYSIVAALRGTADRVIAFEADPRNVAQLEANLLINGLLGRVETVPRAVTGQSGPISFLPMPSSSTGQSRVGEGDGARIVDGVALDDMFDFEGKRIFVKMDIEGHEIEAVKGMKRLMANNRMFLQVESFAENISEFTLIMEQAGFGHRQRIEDDHYFANFDAAEVGQGPG